MKSGCAGYLRKPFSGRALIEAIIGAARDAGMAV
jgi:FixJ family two-component response regulator